MLSQKPPADVNFKILHLGSMPPDPPPQFVYGTTVCIGGKGRSKIAVFFAEENWS